MNKFLVQIFFLNILFISSAFSQPLVQFLMTIGHLHQLMVPVIVQMILIMVRLLTFLILEVLECLTALMNMK